MQHQEPPQDATETEEHTRERLASVAREQLDSDAVFAAQNLLSDFLAGKDVTTMDPAAVAQALSTYLVDDGAGLLRKGMIRFETRLEVSPELTVANVYVFHVPISRSDYVANFLYAPVIKACPTDVVPPASIECSDGTMRFVYRTERYSNGEEPTADEIGRICEDPERRIALAVRAFQDVSSSVARRDGVVREVVDDFRDRYARAMTADAVARGMSGGTI